MDKFCVLMEKYKLIFSCIQYVLALCVHGFQDCKGYIVKCSYFWILKNN